jgi:hypothetical protein
VTRGPRQLYERMHELYGSPNDDAFRYECMDHMDCLARLLEWTDFDYSAKLVSSKNPLETC